MKGSSEDQYSLHPRVYTADQTWTSPGTGPGPRPGPGLHLDLDYTWTWTWTWTSPGHQRFLQIRCLLRFLHQLHLLHLDLLLLSLPRPVIKLVQLQVSWPSEREQRGPILTQPRHLGSRDPSKFRFLLVLQIPLGSAGPRITRATRFTGPPKLTRPSSYLSTTMEREKIHQTHGFTRQRGSILTPSRMSSNLDTWNPETSLGSDPSWFIRFPLAHQAPESPGQSGLPGHPSSPGPAVSSGPRTTRPPKFTVLQLPRKRIQVTWDDGSLLCLYASSC